MIAGSVTLRGSGTESDPEPAFNRRRHGVLGIGDALIHTNPTLGQGTALAMRAAQWVAQQAIGDKDPYEDARRFYRWAQLELHPWYETQISADRATEARLQSGIDDTSSLGSDEQVTIDACASEDADVMRARARVRHLMDHPDAAYAEPDISAKIALWRSSHPRRKDVFDGPARTTWRSIVNNPGQPRAGTAPAAVPVRRNRSTS
jgi:flavin-dependent dehydrogenase